MDDSVSRSRHLDDYGDVLSLADVAVILGRHVETARLWARTGQLPARRVGRSYVVLKTDFIRWLGAQPLTDAAEVAESSAR